MKKLANLKLFLISLTALLGAWTLTPLASAQSFDPFNQSCTIYKLDDKGNPVLDDKGNRIKIDNKAADSPVCKQKKEQADRPAGKDKNPVVRVINTATNILALVAGVGAVIIIIYSGFVFVTAGGALGGQRSGDNPTRARQARSSLTGALIGLIIVALAWSIITFFTNRLL